MSGLQSNFCGVPGLQEPETRQHVPSIEAIQQAVATVFKISVKDMVGGRPTLQINNYPEDVRAARKAAEYLCSKLTDDSAERIAERFGRKRSLVRDAVNAVEQLIDRMFLAARLHRFEIRHVFRHRHDFCSSHLFYQRIPFLMVSMSVRSEQDLDIGKLESQLLDRLFYGGNISLIGAVDQNVPLRRDDQERTQRPGADIVNVAEDLVGRERRGLIFRCAHVTFQYRTRCVRPSLNNDRRMIRRLSIRCDANSHSQQESKLSHAP